PPECLSGCSVCLCGFLSQGVNTPVDIGIVSRIVADQGIDNALRLLTGSCVVEVYEILTVDLLMKHGELLPYSFNIDRAGSSFLSSLHELRIVLQPLAYGAIDIRADVVIRNFVECLGCKGVQHHRTGA